VTLKAVVENLDDVPEPQRALYKEAEGGFRLDVEGVEFPDDVRALRSALERERADNKSLKRKLATMPEDFDPEKWASMTEAQRKAEEESAKDKGQWESYKAQLTDNFAKELKRRDEKLTTRERKIRELLVTVRATTELAELGASARLLMPHIEALTEVTEEDGDWKVYVLGDDGKRRVGKAGDPMSIKELVAEMRESKEYAPAFPSSGASGGGAAPRQGATGGSNGEVKSKADLTSHGMKPWEYISKHGSEAYLSLPDK
jgi:hypothetical protein